jgi:7,8-dihydropterin-6-yl-methyl-4-(beta-D-ribofuranosyl)aminobenzene 5'-phosphate synthase
MSEGILREADSLDVTVLVDNYSDLLLMQSSETVRRPICVPPNVPMAEHGLSCMLRVRSGAEEHVVMMDAGITSECLLHNAKVLRTDLASTEAIVLSHGHFDHFGGLPGLLGQTTRGTPVVLHPDAFLSRRFNIPNVGITPSYQLKEEQIESGGGTIVRPEGPSTLASGLVQVSGEIKRETTFEKGFPFAEALIGGNWQVDPFHDDQAIAVNVKGKGLVVLSGCAHAGIVNSVEHLRRITGVQKVHAIMGGFHLTGPLFDPVIPPTVEAIKAIAPDHIIPMHCTGWKAQGAFAAAMPDRFRLNVVGTTYCFK